LGLVVRYPTGVRLTAGTLLADRYRLTALLGEGGMGEVWSARHVLTGKAVAVKQLTCGVHERHFREARARFAREARSACAVDHPNVVEVFDFVEAEDHSPIMVMELLEGETLAARLARGALPWRELARTLVPVVSAVGTAHARGIVHRDLKPSNIFLDQRPQQGGERVKVLDFGIAKWLAADGEDLALRTRTGSTLGTPSYMAPEQATGDRSADHRVDIWSLGVILYEACSGVRPLEGENAAQLVMRLLSSGIMPIEQLVPELPPELGALIGRMLARDVARRPADLREVYALLRELGGEDSLVFGPPASAGFAEAAQDALRAELPASSAGAAVDAFARTLEPERAAGANVAGALARRDATLPTLSARQVPDALVALETPALSPPAPLERRPRRWARPLGLATLALVVALVTWLAQRAGAGRHGAVVAATATPVLAPREAPGAAARVPSAAPTPLPSTPAPVAPPPLVAIEGLPLASEARLAPSSRSPASAAARPRARRRAAPRRTPPPASAVTPALAAATPAPPASAANEGQHGKAVLPGAPPAASAAPPVPKARGEECERSSECQSRLCVAFACQ